MNEVKKMISWIVIVILVIVGIFAIKMNHLKHRIFIIILVFLALFLYLSIMLVNTQNELDFTNAEGIYDASKVYMGWLANGFKNLKALTGKAIGMDWGSTNSSFIDKTEEDIKEVKKRVGERMRI